MDCEGFISGVETASYTTADNIDSKEKKPKQLKDARPKDEKSAEEIENDFFGDGR